jgi:glycerol-3-phosphate dehydrogenase
MPNTEDLTTSAGTPHQEDVGIYDVAIIGGGATGAGCLLDAASRGLTAILIEGDDLAAGTSSASSKLIHGGLRYLESYEFSLVAEALAERARLMRNAPGLVLPLEFAIPVFSSSKLYGQSKLLGYSATLWGYDLAGSIRSAKVHQRVSAEAIIDRIPDIDSSLLRGGLIYPDAFTDDARLVLALALTAERFYNGKILTHHHAVGIQRMGTLGWEIALRPSEELSHSPTSLIRARSIIASAGVASNLVASLSGTRSRTDISPAKGVHLVVERSKLPIHQAAAIDVALDKRRIFVVPWGRYTYFGTTDTPYYGDLDRPTIETADVTYLLDALNSALSKKIEPHDITGGWVGLRPLITPAQDAPTTKISRKHHLERVAPGLVLISGGKLTTYRHMAEDAVDSICSDLGRTSPSKTKRIALWGSLTAAQRAQFATIVDHSLSGVTHGDRDQRRIVVDALLDRYGSQANTVARSFTTPEDCEEIVEGIGIRRGELPYLYSVEYARTISDVLLRRSRIGILDFERTRKSMAAVAESIKDRFGDSDTTLALQKATLERHLTLPNP